MGHHEVRAYCLRCARRPCNANDFQMPVSCRSCSDCGFRCSDPPSVIGSMQRFRDRIDWIHKYACPPEEQKPLRLAESDGPLNTSLYIHILILIAVAGAVIAGWAILNIKAAGT